MKFQKGVDIPKRKAYNIKHLINPWRKRIMGSIGRYFIEVWFSNGEHGYLMDIYDGGLMLTDHPDAAQRFLTKSGALGYFDSVRDMPSAFDGSAYIVNADVVW